MKSWMRTTLAGMLMMTTVACVSGSGGSEETAEEMAVVSGLQALTDTTSDSSSDVGDSYPATAEINDLRPRFNCTDPSSVVEEFDCDDLTGIATRTVTYTDCEVSNDFRTVTVNGSFTNTVTDGGEGMCDDDEDALNFANVVMGRDGLDAIHDSVINGDGLIFTSIRDNGKEAILTVTGDRTITYTSPIDADLNGMAESTTATVEREQHFVHTVDGEIKHELTAFVTDDDFTSTDEEGNVTTVEVSLPVNTLNFDEAGEYTGRTVTSGQLIVDHEVGQVRMVFGIDEEGLTFDAGTTCGAEEGTMTITGYQINDDESIGPQIGTGTCTYVEGTPTCEFDGEELNIRPYPCK